MASSTKSNQIDTISFPSPHSGPFQRTTLAHVIKIEESMKDAMQMLTEFQVVQLRMAKEEEKQGKILRNLQKFLMDNHANPIVIEEDSLNSHVHNPLEHNEKEEDMEEDDNVVCVGEVCFDKDGNLVEQRGNFCFHYPNCSIHKSPIVKNSR